MSPNQQKPNAMGHYPTIYVFCIALQEGIPHLIYQQSKHMSVYLRRKLSTTGSRALRVPATHRTSLRAPAASPYKSRRSFGPRSSSPRPPHTPRSLTLFASTVHARAANTRQRRAGSGCAPAASCPVLVSHVTQTHTNPSWPAHAPTHCGGARAQQPEAVAFIQHRELFRPCMCGHSSKPRPCQSSPPRETSHATNSSRPRDPVPAHCPRTLCILDPSTSQGKTHM